MRQVLTRRYTKVAEARSIAQKAGEMAADAPNRCLPKALRLPDLVLVDGGRGQVSHGA